MGPAGVRPEARRMGLMLALEIMSLKAMREKATAMRSPEEYTPGFRKWKRKSQAEFPFLRLAALTTI